MIVRPPYESLSPLSICRRTGRILMRRGTARHGTARPNPHSRILLFFYCVFCPQRLERKCNTELSYLSRHRGWCCPSATATRLDCRLSSAACSLHRFCAGLSLSDFHWVIHCIDDDTSGRGKNHIGFLYHYASELYH